MKSALESRPKLKPDVKIVRREHMGRVHYVVKEPKEQKYFQFGETEVELMRLMNGERTPADIAAAAEEVLGVMPETGNVADFAQKLKRLGIVERTPAEQHMILLEHLRANRQVRSRRRTKGSILRLQFSLTDPDSLFTRIVNRIPWVWSRGFVLFSLAVFAAYAVVMFVKWDAVWRGIVNIYTFTGISASDYVLLYGMILVIGIIHEFGHGLTTKAFGGEVRDVGGMILYFSPALYCNTSDAWTFQKRSSRLWVNFAGPWVQLLIASFAGLVWVFTEPGVFVNRLAFLAYVAGGILSLLSNLNPLLPLDGYYALSDWLEIPSLRRRSFEYWSWIGKRYLLGMDVAEPPTTPRERRIFLIYGAAAIGYSGFVIVVSLAFLILVQAFGPVVSYALVALIAFGVAKRIAGRSRAIGQAVATSWRAALRGGRRTAGAVGLLVLGAAVILVLPWTFRVGGEVVVEATPRSHVRAEVAGVLDSWYVQEGDVVLAGESIARLWNPKLESAFLSLQSRALRTAVERARAAAQGDRAGAAAAQSVLDEVEQELAVLRAQHERLVVRAKIGGVVLGHRLHERLGSAVAEGDLLVEVVAAKGRLARIRVPQGEAGEVAAGQTATLKFSAQPGLEFKSRVASVAPATKDGWLVAEVVIPDGKWQPKPGMEGAAKIETRRATVAQAIARAVRKTVRIDLWL